MLRYDLRIGIAKGLTWFLKPFSQIADTTIDRTTTLYSHLFQHKSVEPIIYEKLTQLIALGETDELLKKQLPYIVNAANHDVIIVEGLVPNGQDHFASKEINAALAQALDAQVVLVSTVDLADPRKNS